MSADTIERSELTPKQKAFVDHYLVTGNGVDSAQKAGYAGNYETLAQVAAENLRKPYIAKALGQRTHKAVEKAGKRIVNTYEEFQKNLDFVGKLRDACEQWLNSTGEFAIDPRTDEIDVIYWDYSQDPPQQVKDRLDRVLAGAEGRELPKLTPFIKTVDLREYALKVIDRIDTTLDKFAKMGGDYTKDKTNPADTEAFIKATAREMWLNSGPFSDNEQRDHYAKRISEKTGIDPLKEFGEPVEWVN